MEIKINIRLQKYKKNRLAGMNKYNAARAAGFSESTARTHTKRLDEQIKITDLMERQGLTDRWLLERLSHLIGASKDIYRFTGLGEEEKGVTVRLGTPDWAARAKGLEMALKLKDLLKEKLEHSGKVATGETRIIFVNGTQDNSNRIPKEVSI